jgi:hypothetical protein
MDMILAGRARTSQNPKWNTVVVTAIATLPANEELRIYEASMTPESECSASTSRI